MNKEFPRVMIDVNGSCITVTKGLQNCLSNKENSFIVVFWKICTLSLLFLSLDVLDSITNIETLRSYCIIIEMKFFCSISIILNIQFSKEMQYFENKFYLKQYQKILWENEWAL